MGGLFSTRTSVPIAETDQVQAGLCIPFSLDGCYDIPVGPPIDLVVHTTIVGKGVVEFLKITREKTHGHVRVLPEGTAPGIHALSHSFVHNYILWPDQPIGELRAGKSFETLKDKQRRFPLGPPIDLALGKNFTIVASIIVKSISVTKTHTTINAEIILVYSSRESKLLTKLNRRRETIKERLG